MGVLKTYSICLRFVTSFFPRRFDERHSLIINKSGCPVEFGTFPRSFPSCFPKISYTFTGFDVYFLFILDSDPGNIAHV